MGCLTGSGAIFTRGLGGGGGSHLLSREKIFKRSSSLIFRLIFEILKINVSSITINLRKINTLPQILTSPTNAQQQAEHTRGHA